MGKYKVEITEILVGVIEVEADTLSQAIDKVRASHEEAGYTIKKLETEEMTARITYSKDKEKTIRLI